MLFSVLFWLCNFLCSPFQLHIWQISAISFLLLVVYYLTPKFSFRTLILVYKYWHFGFLLIFLLPFNVVHFYYTANCFIHIFHFSIAWYLTLRCLKLSTCSIYFYVSPLSFFPFTFVLVLLLFINILRFVIYFPSIQDFVAVSLSFDHFWLLGHLQNIISQFYHL